MARLVNHEMNSGKNFFAKFRKKLQKGLYKVNFFVYNVRGSREKANERNGGHEDEEVRNRHECIWTYTVTARTASMITLADEKGKEIKCRIIKAISEMDNREAVRPLGNYSMAPILRA